MQKGQNLTAAVVDGVKGQVFYILLVQVLGNQIVSWQTACPDTLGPAIEYASLIREGTGWWVLRGGVGSGRG